MLRDEKMQKIEVKIEEIVEKKEEVNHLVHILSLLNTL